MIRALFASLLLALSACAAAQQAPPAPAWFVTRHLQKSEGADPALTQQGQACAVRLAERLAGEGIGAIYVSSTRRTRETAAPLAARLGIAPVEYDPRDTPALLARLRRESGRVLVVGHSNTVPDIVAGLGGARPGPIADDRYGDLWLVPADGTPISEFRIDGC